LIRSKRMREGYEGTSSRKGTIMCAWGTKSGEGLEILP
jgi:hypothetical protein